MVKCATNPECVLASVHIMNIQRGKSGALGFPPAPTYNTGSVIKYSCYVCCKLRKSHIFLTAFVQKRKKFFVLLNRKCVMVN